MGICSVILLFVFLGNTVFINCLTTKTCSRIERSMLDGITRYFTDFFCCGNHEPMGKYCKECEPGYTSVNGEKCKRCDDGNYGKRCAELCLCNKTSRCDYIHGCVPVLPNGMSTEEQNFWSTDNLNESETTTYGNHGLSESFSLHAVIYILCVVCTIIGMALLNICIRYARQKESFRVHSSGNSQSIPGTIQINRRGREHDSEEIRLYDEIDETGIIMDFPVIGPVGLPNDGSSYTEGYISNDGYLNPYQPIILYNAHKYTKFHHMSGEKKTHKPMPGSLKCLKIVQGNRFMSARNASENASMLRIDQGTSNLSKNEFTGLYGFKRKDRWSV